ncbi:MAG: hypothetical protein P4L86_21625 [Mycobacterium sp.]|nr:hypothetical protein [Mycobacterium sp.]
MSVLAMHDSNATAKLQVGMAACAIAAAATLTPTIAHAAPIPLAPITHVLDNTIAGRLDFVPQDLTWWLQNDPWWWFGPGTNPTPPAPILVGTFTPLSIIPGFLQPLWKQLTANINFSSCFFGLGAKIGPYGTITVSLTRGC